MIKIKVAEKGINFYVITRSFAKTIRRGDLKTIRNEIATAPKELRNDNKKYFFSPLRLKILFVFFPPLRP